MKTAAYARAEFFALIGLPEELIKLEKNYLELAASLNFIERCERPEHSPESTLPLFHGKISLDHDRKSVVGMSGGPIFAFEMVDGQLKYWLVAVQSTWYPESKIVVGCPTKFLGLTLEHALKNVKGD